jgi:hypothetical protein
VLESGGRFETGCTDDFSVGSSPISLSTVHIRVGKGVRVATVHFRELRKREIHTSRVGLHCSGMAHTRPLKKQTEMSPNAVPGEMLRSRYTSSTYPQEGTHGRNQLELPGRDGREAGVLPARATSPCVVAQYEG